MHSCCSMAWGKSLAVVGLGDMSFACPDPYQIKHLQAAVNRARDLVVHISRTWPVTCAMTAWVPKWSLTPLREAKNLVPTHTCMSVLVSAESKSSQGSRLILRNAPTMTLKGWSIAFHRARLHYWNVLGLGIRACLELIQHGWMLRWGRKACNHTFSQPMRTWVPTKLVYILGRCWGTARHPIASG